MSRMSELLTHVAKQLVDKPDAVAEEDVGKVIGRGGRIAKAIRSILKVMATRDGTKVNLEID